MKVYPVWKKNMLNFGKKNDKPDHLNNIGYSSQLDMYYNHHPFLLNIGIFVFIFDIKIMIFSVILNEIVNLNTYQSYEFIISLNIQIFALLKIILLFFYIYLDKKEFKYLNAFNPQKIINKKRYIITYFYILISCVNNFPIDRDNYFFEYKQINESLDYIYSFNIHDFLSVICILRTFYSITFILNLLIVNKTAYRFISATYGVEKGEFFSTRYFFKEYPIVFSITLLLIIVSNMTLAVRILERSNPVYDFSSLTNSVYFMTTTVTTLGYGDYYPFSNYSRIVCMALMIFGVININLINYAMISFFKMTKHEDKALSTFIKMEVKEKLQTEFISLFLYIKRANKLLKVTNMPFENQIAKIYVNKIYNSFRRMRIYQMKYDSLHSFSLAEESSNNKSNLDFEFSMFLGNLEQANTNVVEIRKKMVPKATGNKRKGNLFKKSVRVKNYFN